MLPSLCKIASSALRMIILSPIVSMSAEAKSNLSTALSVAVEIGAIETPSPSISPLGSVVAYAAVVLGLALSPILLRHLAQDRENTP